MKYIICYGKYLPIYIVLILFHVECCFFFSCKCGWVLLFFLFMCKPSKLMARRENKVDMYLICLSSFYLISVRYFSVPHSNSLLMFLPKKIKLLLFRPGNWRNKKLNQMIIYFLFPIKHWLNFKNKSDNFNNLLQNTRQKNLMQTTKYEVKRRAVKQWKEFNLFIMTFSFVLWLFFWIWCSIVRYIYPTLVLVVILLDFKWKVCFVIII